ncbi:Spy/CpxP family protein refolding chaperone [Neisseria sp. ZJ106]|uniref:Spy/CpxP family protein refolding chaperone n=1 Tax=Neisseria lisongii TaxID=2912188 RepID=A0AAW5AL86_9NEIS|nr:Spy/CpxP family protein refolding chaperone [Neisseria lisongii]MCF7521485.1 Spy/CpxP family protein refolding chaperone [Neisseria lisongii]MCF7529191.1 Spy/CpxP family protein refolding chaperone [Neisseria lisongii]WCL72266.1 Spy/CpxP family protein refolding chaperone [Neisseria lisongii]
MPKARLPVKMFCVALLVCSVTAEAAPIHLDDFSHNCDIRPLNLSREQHDNLRRIRIEYKKAYDRSVQKAARSERNRRQNIMKIMASDVFDNNSARDYVEARYLSGMDYSVEELALQHRFYHLLTPQQQKVWLATCVR